MHKNTGKSPFQIVYESITRNASKLRQLNKGEISSAEAKDFVEHLKNIYEEVRKHIIKMNTQYKAKVDVKMRYKEFQIGDEVMVHFRNDYFPMGRYNNL